jgi:hypothetical protein
MRYATGTENDFKEEYRGIYAKELNFLFKTYSRNTELFLF